MHAGERARTAVAAAIAANQSLRVIARRSTTSGGEDSSSSSSGGGGGGDSGTSSSDTFNAKPTSGTSRRAPSVISKGGETINVMTTHLQTDRYGDDVMGACYCYCSAGAGVGRCFPSVNSSNCTDPAFAQAPENVLNISYFCPNVRTAPALPWWFHCSTCNLCAYVSNDCLAQSLCAAAPIALLLLLLLLLLPPPLLLLLLLLLLLRRRLLLPPRLLQLRRRRRV
jgi:hypothetical protein